MHRPVIRGWSLERDPGAVVFERHARGVRATEVGTVLQSGGLRRQLQLRVTSPGAEAVVGASPSLTGAGWRERGGYPRQDYGAERCWVLWNKVRALP